MFRCDGRRGGVRAETEGAGSGYGTEPVCRSLRRQSGGVGTCTIQPGAMLAGLFASSVTGGMKVCVSVGGNLLNPSFGLSV